MMTPPTPQTAFKMDFKAKKHPLILLLGGFFVIFGLLFVNETILGATIFEDSFDDYDVGEKLNLQTGWENSTDEWYITDDYCYSGNCIVATTSPPQYARRKGNELNATGSISFWFYFENEPSSAHSFYLYDDLTPSAPAQLTNLRFLNDEIFYYASGLTYTKIFDFATGTWNFIIADFDISGATSTIRFNFNGSWTNWLDPAYDRTEVDRVDFLFGYGSGGWKIDEISEAGDVCQFYQTWNTCENAGCCWYFSNWLQQNFCVACPTGSCASGVYECQNCLTQENCEAQEFCYWFNETCRYGTGVCNEGLELQFCENQTECENAGGYWYDDYCWISAKPTLINWGDYYDEHGDYATPSAWISGVASSSSSFFESIGGFLSTFRENFDLQEAYQKGNDFGSAIPVARGYLGILNDFMGGLPFGEFFAFILIFMLAIGVFRIVRNLIQLLKFW